MRRLVKYILASVVLCMTFTRCNDFLHATSPSNVDNDFVTSTPSETLKTLTWCYANYRQACVMGTYRWNDPIGSDTEMYPEQLSSNNINAILLSDQLPINYVDAGFNGLYTTLARAAKVADIIAGKEAYQTDLAAGRVSDWTHLYGEAMTIRAFCYFDLIKHFGDVPYGLENKLITSYTLTSRFDIYDNLIASLRAVEPLMYKLGEGGVTAERFSRTFCDALIGELALFSGGYQTIRTDMPGLYKDLSFTNKGTEQYGCVYARRSDYQDYYKIAEQYFQAATVDNKGSANLITSDTRTPANPFQRHFQYFADLQVSPESLFELGNTQGGTSATTSEYPYAFGRPSNGGSTLAAPAKTFGALRIIPTVYYGSFQSGDRRRDASVAVTGSNGDGNEIMLSFVPGNKSTGGISTNKWDENRMTPPYVASQRQSGMNWPILRMADVILMLAEVKAELGESADALSLVNQIRERAFGNTTHDLVGLSGDALKDAVMEERKLELLGEGTRRWDLIRSGKFSEKAMAVRQEMLVDMIGDLKSKGYHQFANGNIISSYIWTKKVTLANPLTYECPNPADPVLFPGWRGQFDYTTVSTVSSKVKGTTRNVAIQGLFTYIDPASAAATTLQASGYVKTNWGIDIVNNAASYDRNILSGIKSANDPPRYYFPMPASAITSSKGAFTNGYQLPQE